MKDRVPTKPNRYAVYDDNHNFIGYEYHERADEPTEAGSALNKANLLPDDVAAALWLTGDPQVKDAICKLARNTIFSDTYYWHKYLLDTQIVLGGLITDNSIKFCSSYSGQNTGTVSYSDYVDINLDNGTAVLRNPVTANYSWSDYSALSVLKNKYFKKTYGDQAIFFAANNAEILQVSENGFGYIVLKNGYKPNFVISKTFESLVNSPNPNAYPQNGRVDNRYFEYLGKPDGKFPVKTAWGSYKGTGTYGSSNPNVLHFNFKPQFVILLSADESVEARFGFILPQEPYNSYTKCGMNDYLAGSTNDLIRKAMYAKVADNTLYWFSLQGASYQFNANMAAYYYFAIG